MRLLLLLLLLPLMAAALNPVCKPPTPTGAAPPKDDYIFIFDTELGEAKTEQWKYMAKMMSCSLPLHENVRMAVAEKRGNETTRSPWMSSMDFADYLPILNGSLTDDVYACPKLEDLPTVTSDNLTTTHIVMMIDTERKTACDVGDSFETAYPPNVVLDEVHLGPRYESDHLRVRDEWDHIDVTKETLLISTNYSHLAMYSDVQDQILLWARGKKKSSKTRPSTPAEILIPLNNETTETTVATSEEPPPGNGSLVEEQGTTTTTTMLAEAAGNSTDGPETTLEETETTTEAYNTTMGPVAIEEQAGSNGTESYGTEGPATIAGNTTLGPATNETIQVSEAEASVWILKRLLWPILLGGGGGARTTTKRPPPAAARNVDFGQWLHDHWVWILVAIIVLILLVLALVVCIVAMRKKETRRRRGESTRGRADGYKRLGAEIYDVSSTTARSGRDGIPVVNGSESSMDETQRHTALNMDALPAPSPIGAPDSGSRQSLLLPPPSSSAADEQQPPPPLPHAAEDAVDPYSPALPSPSEVRHSEVALSPVQPMSSFASRPPPAKPPRTPKLLDASTRGTDAFEM